MCLSCIFWVPGPGWVCPGGGLGLVRDSVPRGPQQRGLTAESPQVFLRGGYRPVGLSTIPSSDLCSQGLGSLHALRFGPELVC